MGRWGKIHYKNYFNICHKYPETGYRLPATVKCLKFDYVLLLDGIENKFNSLVMYDIVVLESTNKISIHVSKEIIVKESITSLGEQRFIARRGENLTKFPHRQYCCPTTNVFMILFQNDLVPGN